MFYAIIALLVFSIVLLITDYHSRYSWLFVMMVVGMVIAFFSISMHLTVFGNYYYSHSKLFSLDYSIFSYVSRMVKIPLSTMARMMNVGIALYLLAVPLFVYEFTRGNSRYKGFKKHLVSKIIALMLLILFNLWFYDPHMAYRIYVRYKMYPPSTIFASMINALHQINRFCLIVFLFYPIYILYRCAVSHSIRYIKKQVFSLAVCLCIMDLLFYSVFYMSPFMMSPSKAFLSGFWIFENITLVSYQYYLFIPLITICVSLFTLLLLLVNYRMGSLVHIFVDREIQRNISSMNDALSDTLHSQKNILFSINLLAQEAIARKDDSEQSDALCKIRGITESSLRRTSEMLDTLRDIRYKFGNNNLIDAVDDAVQKLSLPPHISIRWDRKQFECDWDSLCCRFDRYHITRAFVNILCNAVEAIELAERGQGIIRIDIALQFQWIIIVIQDNGTGIKKSSLKKMFQPYFSEKSSTSNWGLGLSYTYKVVKAHWGHLRVESKLGEGTVVQIMLPYSTNGKGGPSCRKFGF